MPICKTTSKKMTMKTNAIPAQVNVGCVPLWTTQPKKKHHDPNKDWDTMSTSNWHWNDINYIILYTVIGTISRSQGNPLQREFHIYGFHSVSYSKRRHSTAGGIFQPPHLVPRPWLLTIFHWPGSTTPLSEYGPAWYRALETQHGKTTETGFPRLNLPCQSFCLILFFKHMLYCLELIPQESKQKKTIHQMAWGFIIPHRFQAWPDERVFFRSWHKPAAGGPGLTFWNAFPTDPYPVGWGDNIPIYQYLITFLFRT